MKNLTVICEARISLEKSTNEAQAKPGRLEARVTTWGAREGADGRKFNYQPEGFADWAKEFAEADRPLPMFLNHNAEGMPYGQWDEVIFDDEGMLMKGELFMETVGGSDVYSVLKESPKLFGGVSVGAYADEYQFVDEAGEPLVAGHEDDGYFQITKGGLREVSIVMYPNNPAAEIQRLECFDAEGHLNPRSLEKLLREAGVPKKDATTASSIFKRILEQREAPKPNEVAPTQSESDAVVPEAEDNLLEAIKQWELLKELNKRIK